MDGNPFGNNLTWSAVPAIIILVLAIVVASFFYTRRRRQNQRNGNQTWPGHPPRDVEGGYRSSNNRRAAGGRRRGWAGDTTRADEGLDEFGEAPPMYSVKAEPGTALEAGAPARGEVTADMRNSYELEEIETARGSGSGPRANDAGNASQSPRSSVTFNNNDNALPTASTAAPRSPPAASTTMDSEPPAYGSLSDPSRPTNPTGTITTATTINGGTERYSPPPLITTPPPAVTFHRS